MAMARSGAPMATNLVRAMGDADYVLIDGVIFESAYLGAPDDVTGRPTTSCSRRGMATRKSPSRAPKWMTPNNWARGSFA